MAPAVPSPRPFSGYQSVHAEQVRSARELTCQEQPSAKYEPMSGWINTPAFLPLGWSNSNMFYTVFQMSLVELNPCACGSNLFLNAWLLAFFLSLIHIPWLILGLPGIISHMKYSYSQSFTPSQLFGGSNLRHQLVLYKSVSVWTSKQLVVVSGWWNFKWFFSFALNFCFIKCQQFLSSLL